MKVIFLDVDGVLNTDEMRESYGIDFISPRLVKEIIRVADATEAKIVISSDWRLKKRDLDMVHAAFKDCGFDTGRIIGVTPVYTLHGTRAMEIAHWLAQRPGVEKAVIIDDIEDAEVKEESCRFFQTDYEVGVTAAIADGMIEFLNG